LSEDGLYDKHILFIAKIVNLTDSFDAMTIHHTNAVREAKSSKIYRKFRQTIPALTRYRVLPRNAQRIDRREKRQKVSLNVRQRLPASRRNRSTIKKRAQRYERDFIFDFGEFGLTAFWKNIIFELILY